MTIFVFHLLCIFIEINFSGGNCSNMLSFQVENQQNHLKLTAIILKKKLYYPLDALSYDFDVQFEIHSTIDFLLKRSKKRYASQFEKQF